VRLTRDYASLVEEERHVVGIRVSEDASYRICSSSTDLTFTTLSRMLLLSYAISLARFSEQCVVIRGAHRKRPDTTGTQPPLCFSASILYIRSGASAQRDRRHLTRTISVQCVVIRVAHRTPPTPRARNRRSASVPQSSTSAAAPALSEIGSPSSRRGFDPVSLDTSRGLAASRLNRENRNSSSNLPCMR